MRMDGRQPTAASIDWSNRESVQHWLEQQPGVVSAAVAARAALRVLPLAVHNTDDDDLPAVALAIFRASAILWAAARYPNRRKGLQLAAAVVSAAVSRVAAEADEVAAAAAGAAANATACLTVDSNMRISSAVDAAAAVEHAGAAVAFAEIISSRFDVSDADDAARIDAVFFETTQGEPTIALHAARLAHSSLWLGGTPDWASSEWGEVRRNLLATNQDWNVWTRWYEDRLVGVPSLGETFDIRLARLPEHLWKQGPKAVNAEIRRLIEEHTPAEPIPAQGAGPHFGLSLAHKIGLAAASDIDAAGNNLGRLREQLPLVREAAGDLAGRLNPNVFPELARNLAAYGAAIEGEPETIAWGVVFGRGVRLDNAAAAARRQIEDRLQPPLEDAAQEALESLLTLHGPMILATVEGRELMDDAGRMLLTRDAQSALRRDALAVATALHEDKEVIEPVAAEIVMESVETIGEGPHPERGSVVGGAAIRNVTIWAVGIAAIAAIAGVGFVQAGVAVITIEGLKKSKRFSALTDALGARIDGVLRTGAAFQNFVVRNEQPLRQMASNSAGMRWMLPYIDEVIRSNRPH